MSRVSKERARRRSEREAAAGKERARRDAQRDRAAKRAAVVGSVASPANRAGAWWARWRRRTFPPADPFNRRRKREWLVLIAILLVIQVLAWWLMPASFGLRLGVLGLSLLILPVVRVILFDRR